MIEIPSTIEGAHIRLSELERILKPMGYTIGGNWDYDHGYFDRKIADKDGYLFLRLPFSVVEGQLDSDVCTVEVQRPFLLNHVFQAGLDDHAHHASTLNQFSEPVDKDGSIPPEFEDIGKSLLHEVEAAIR